LDDQWSSAFFIVYFILLLGQLILVSFADEPYDDGSFVAEVSDSSMTILTSDQTELTNHFL